MSESTSVKESATKLEALIVTILTEVAKLDTNTILWKPGPEAWSVMEILCHIDEFLPYWTKQLLQIAREPGKQWGRDHTDSARRAAVQSASLRSSRDLIESIHNSAAVSVSAIRELSDCDLLHEAISRNQRWGIKPASFVMNHLLIEHLEKHLNQIRRNQVQCQLGPQVET